MTESSPALADVRGNGTLAVLEGTDGGPGGGTVYALDAATARSIWSRSVGAVHGGVVTADLGEGYQDVVVASTTGAEVLDGHERRRGGRPGTRRRAAKLAPGHRRPQRDDRHHRCRL